MRRLLLAAGLIFFLSASSFDDTVVKLNPDYRLKRIGCCSIAMVSTDGSRHEFTDVYADILIGAYRKQRLGYIVSSISEKYYLSEEDCRREIKHALNVLVEWNIVLR